MIPERVKRLVTDHITSVEQLEILLLLRKSSERTWTAEQVNAAINSSLPSVTMRLDDLAARGFVRNDGGAYRYVASGDLDVATRELDAAYAESRFAIIDLIFSKPTDRVRIFADAFRVRRNGDG